jgi:hypothetical protein
MIASPTRLMLFAALLLPLSGCGNSPQQPSDTVDDQSSESPYLDGSADETSTDFAELEEPTEAPEVTGSVPTPRPSLDVVAGRWAVDTATCEAEGGADVVISATSFEMPGRVCRVAATTYGGDGSVTATISCPVGAMDETESELVKLVPEGETMTLSFVGSAAPDQNLSRCP